MEEKTNSDLSYKGPNKWWSAVKSFTAASTLMTVGPAAIAAAWFKVSRKENFLMNLKEFVVGEHTWGKLGTTITLLFGAASAFGAYVKATVAQDQHTKLVADNIAMRAQLNQTGQILRHVADEVGKGKIADSSLVLDESKTPSSHVARLEAQEAAASAQAALTKI
jgi:hypothetical protein